MIPGAKQVHSLESRKTNLTQPPNAKLLMLRKHAFTSLLTLASCALLAVGTAAQLQAAEKSNPTGTWTWKTPGRNGGEGRTATLKLKKEGEKVTGKLSTPGRQGGDARETDIEDGKIDGDELSFKVTREFNNNKFVQKYHGKVSGDSIKGKVEFDRGGETQSRDWEAKREETK